MSNNKALMTHYAEGALISRELHDMVHQYAADARFEAELSRYEDAERARWVADNIGRLKQEKS